MLSCELVRVVPLLISESTFQPAEAYYGSDEAYLLAGHALQPALLTKGH